jgi:hypothetical protein
LKLENLTSRHHFRHDATGNSEFAAVTTLTINCGELLRDIGKAFVPAVQLWLPGVLRFNDLRRKQGNVVV